jgi:transcriptional regulator with PAS, ATPase and Fis domain
VADLKRRLIAEGLERSHGSVTRAAKLLGVSRDSFNYMVKALGVKK